MLSLTDYIEDSFNFQDKEISVDMAFDNILRLFEMFDDPEVEKWEAPVIALQMLLNEFDDLYFENYEQMFELFKYVLKEFLDINLDDHLEESKQADGNGESQTTPKKIMDYKKDADLIYASFFAVYKMDLIDLQGKLHWKKFQALLNHLDDNSPFKQVIGYRTMKVPSEKEASKDYISHVRKMKNQYALEESNDTDSAFNSLSMMFKARAKKGG